MSFAALAGTQGTDLTLEEACDAVIEAAEDHTTGKVVIPRVLLLDLARTLIEVRTWDQCKENYGVAD